jgi:asparagine synthase (glutamine-hydrolysing)
MEGLLPEEVRWRSTKANLTPNFLGRLFDNDRNTLKEVVFEQSGALEEFVDISALRRAHDRCNTQPISEADALTVFGAVVLGLWLQRAKIA